MADALEEQLSGSKLSPEMLKAVADTLRRRQAFQEMFQIGGDAQLQKFGQAGQANDRQSIEQSGHQAELGLARDQAQSQFERSQTNLEGHQLTQEQQARDASAQNLLLEKMREAQQQRLQDQAIAAGKYQHNQDAEADRKQRMMNQQVDKIATSMKDLTPLAGAMNQVGAMLNKYTDDKGNLKDIPGVGGLHNKGGIMGSVADMFGSGTYQEAQDNKNAIAQLKDTIIKAMAGTAVSESEGQRMLQELQTATTSGQGNFGAAMLRMRDRVNSQLSNAYAHGDKDALAEYFDRNPNAMKEASPINFKGLGAAGVPSPSMGGGTSQIPPPAASASALPRSTGLLSGANGAPLAYSGKLTGAEPVSPDSSVGGKKVLRQIKNTKTGQIGLLMEDGTVQPVPQ